MFFSHNFYIMLISPEWDSNLGQHRMAAFEDCQATTLTSQPQRLNKSEFFVILTKSFLTEQPRTFDTLTTQPHFIQVVFDNPPLVMVGFTAILNIEAPETMQCKKC